MSSTRSFAKEWHRCFGHQDAVGLVDFGDLLPRVLDDSFRLVSIQKQVVRDVPTVLMAPSFQQEYVPYNNIE